MKVVEEKYIPSIIEPAFGFGRVLYSLLEHSFYTRDDIDELTKKGLGDGIRTSFNFKPFMAPIKCSILPMMSKKELLPFVHELGIYFY